MTLLQKVQNLKWTPDLPYKLKEILLELITGGGTAQQTLQQVSDTGGLDNGSTIREGGRDNGFGGGISQICTNEKELQWENGVQYYFPVGGDIIYANSMNNDIPNNYYDNTKGWAVGSRFKNLISGIEYVCTENTTEAAEWEEVNSYSTDEVLTGGTWIDDKPIYRKVIEITDTNSAFTYTHNLSIDKYIRHEFNGLIDDAKYIYSLNVNTIFGTGITLGDIVYITNSISVENPNSLPISNAVLVLEYTKTTD